MAELERQVLGAVAAENRATDTQIRKRLADAAQELAASRAGARLRGVVVRHNFKDPNSSTAAIWVSEKARPAHVHVTTTVSGDTEIVTGNPPRSAIVPDRVEALARPKVK